MDNTAYQLNTIEKQPKIIALNKIEVATTILVCSK